MKGHALASAPTLRDYACDICSSEIDKWDLLEDEELFQFCDMQRQRQASIPASLFAEEETLSGYCYNPEGILQDDFARALSTFIFFYTPNTGLTLDGY